MSKTVFHFKMSKTVFHFKMSKTVFHFKMSKTVFHFKIGSSIRLLPLFDPIIRSKSSVATCEEFDHSDVTSESRPELGISYGNVNFDETKYYFQDGLRKVYPYYFTYFSFCKQRWIGKNLVDMYSNEFVSATEESVEEKVANGTIRVNGRIVPLDYELKNSDRITNAIHRHETAVLAAPVKIMKNDEVVVVEKPPSVPVHPTGPFRHNSLLFILAKEHNLKGLYVLNRLDRLTSGVLLLTKTKEKSRELHQEMESRNIHKEYVSRVEGRFPDGVITCSKPLRNMKGKVSFTVVSHSGRDSVTEFERISYNGKSSVVICRPLTGRTHQIRVHLQYLGHPIVNDPIYNSHDFGPMKGKDGVFGKPLKEVVQDVFKSKVSNSQNVTNCLDNVQSSIVNSYCNTSEYRELAELYIRDEKMFQFDTKCIYCKSSFKDPVHSDMFIFLHAVRYQGDGWDYSTEMPEWAKSDWNVL